MDQLPMIPRVTTAVVPAVAPAGSLSLPELRLELALRGFVVVDGAWWNEVMLGGQAHNWVVYSPADYPGGPLLVSDEEKPIGDLVDRICKDLGAGKLPQVERQKLEAALHRKDRDDALRRAVRS